MRRSVQCEKVGLVDYVESYWTGKKEIYFNGKKLQMQSKNTYVWNGEDQTKTVTLSGNLISGVKMQIDGTVVQLTPKAYWYEVVCSVMIFMLIIVWGSSVDLCRIVPIVGGAIGGGISGGMGFANLVLMKSHKKIAFKLAIWGCMLVATFGICFVVAKILLATVYA